VALSFLLVSVRPLVAVAQQADSARAGVRVSGDSAKGAVTPPPRPARVRRAAVPDSLAPPVSPGRAFLLSLALPGLGQSRLNRPTAGGVYFTAEAVWHAMLGKAAHDLRVAKAHEADVIVQRYRVNDVTGSPVLDSGRFVPLDTLRSKYAEPIPSGSAATGQEQRSRVKARRLHFEDWIAMIAFTHLFSAADAYVSSHLWDLPAQVELRALPRGTGIGLSIPFR